MKNPSWYEDPPEDPPEDGAESDNDEANARRRLTIDWSYLHDPKTNPDLTEGK